MYGMVMNSLTRFSPLSALTGMGTRQQSKMARFNQTSNRSKDKLLIREYSVVCEVNEREEVVYSTM